MVKCLQPQCSPLTTRAKPTTTKARWMDQVAVAGRTSTPSRPWSKWLACQEILCQDFFGAKASNRFQQVPAGSSRFPNPSCKSSACTCWSQRWRAQGLSIIQYMSKRASVQSYQVTELPRDIPESDSVESTRTLGAMIECSLCSEWLKLGYAAMP